MSDDNRAETIRLITALNSLADIATAKLRAFESDMSNLGLGQAATIKIGELYLLSYTKHNGKWQLTLNDTPALQTNRDARILAAAHLAQLEEAIRNALRARLTS